jgi:tRNA (cytidine/uridine-2'-O-)-methyltransferase
MTNKQIVLSPVDAAWGSETDTKLHLVLVEPEIPANTGNIARLCAGTGAVLHLVEPLGFVLQDRYLRRAGLDYWPGVTLCVHPNWEAIAAIFGPEQLRLMTTRATRSHAEATAAGGTAFVMGRESRGLPQELLDRYPDAHFRIPITDRVRSLNLANASAIVLYEAARQLGFPGMR